jgi:hypothetical protein
MNDDELIAALAAGDDAALRELFTRHAPWLAARLRAALPPPDVEDVLQETFLAVWRGGTGHRPVAALPATVHRRRPDRAGDRAACAGRSWRGPQRGVLVLARNVTGFTGLGLACSLVTGGLLAWTLPLGYMLFCQYALLELWRAPWAWPVRPAADRGAWICASVVFAVGLLLFTVRGPRTRLSDNG